MTRQLLLAIFREIWCVDFEFIQRDGEVPWPLCLIAIEYYSGRIIRLWRDDLLRLRRAPFPTGADALFVAYSASAELSCFLELGWPLPVHTLDLFFEHRAQTNVVKPSPASLIEALARHGLAKLDPARKEAFRARILAGPPYSGPEQRDILEYCAEDVQALLQLLPRMVEGLHWPQALLRGRCAGAVARMERAGVPIDVPTWQRLSERWEALRLTLIADVDRSYHVYEGDSFRNDRFANLVAQRGIRWPFYPSGQPVLEARVFRDMSGAYPELAPLHQLRQSMGKMRLTGLSVGRDGNNRTPLKALRTLSGRNSPSNSRYIFGPATWMRSLIRPPKGWGLAYADWRGQEYALAAAFSGDAAMIRDYRTGDPYMAFARAAGLAPADATAASHPTLRGQCKIVCLGTNYGMTPYGTALRLDMLTAEARVLHQAHRVRPTPLSGAGRTP